MKKVLIVDDVKGWRDYHAFAINSIMSDELDIDFAESANDGYNKIIENLKNPYDIVITDLQMEDDFAPKLAGEWLVEQIKTFSQYYKAKIIIISASYNIKQIAEYFGVTYIRKSDARNNTNLYEEFLV